MARCSWASSGSLCSGERAEAEREKRTMVRVRSGVKVVKSFVNDLFICVLIVFLRSYEAYPRAGRGL